MPKIALQEDPSRYEIETRVGWITIDIVRLTGELAKHPELDKMPLADQQPILAGAVRRINESETDISTLEDAELVSKIVAALDHYESLGKGAAS